MGVGSSRVARSNSRKQQPQPKPEPVVPVLTTTQPSPPSLPTAVRSRTKYGIDEPDLSRAHSLPAGKPPMVQRSQSARSPESAARITERHAQRMRRAYGSEDGQFHPQQRSSESCGISPGCERELIMTTLALSDRSCRPASTQSPASSAKGLHIQVRLLACPLL